MRKYLVGFIAGVVLAVLAACGSNAGGTRPGTITGSNGTLSDVPVTKVYTTDGRALDCIVLENSTREMNAYAIAITCDWGVKAK